MTSVFSWPNSVSLCPASFCTLRPNLPVNSRYLLTSCFAVQSPVMKRASFFVVSSGKSRGGKRSLDIRDFPDSSVGKESACNAGDPGSIPGSGRCPGEGIGYLFQYTWASFMIQLLRIHLQCGRPGFDS